MKILRLYCSEGNKREKKYGTDSPLMKAIREKYGCDEVVLEEGAKEEEYAELIRQYNVLLTGWGNPHIPNELAENCGKLRYICNITGELARWIDVPLVECPHLIITNWGDAPAFGVAEGAFALLMAVMKNIPKHVDNARNNGVNRVPTETQVSLYKKKVGIYGMGVIGRKFIDFLRPFSPDIYAYDPYAKDIPEGVTMVDSLGELFSISQIVAVHAGWTKETEGSVNKEMLAKLPDGGIIINTARAAIVDYEALREELLSRRLRAGIDLATIKSPMPPVDDPVRMLDNVIFSCYSAYMGAWGVDPEELDFAALNCLENLQRFADGKELKFVMTPARYRIST